MQFSQVIGQSEAIGRLRQQADGGRMPHALLFCGPEGCGKLATAWALACRLLCQHPEAGDACGHCPACKMSRAAVHPDLHFAFPVVKPKGSKGAPVSDLYLDAWRQQLRTTPYFDRATWLERMGTENQQAQIYVEESNLILRKLSLKASQGGYKVMIVWQPELMNAAAANKLLKLLEEPPEGTVFVLVSERPEALLGTIVSRTQRIDFMPIGEDELAAALERRNALDPATARAVSHMAGGSYARALTLVSTDEEADLFFDTFVSLMRLCYARKIKDLQLWSEQVAAWGRERQKHFLAYCQRLVRENFVYNFRQPAMNYMGKREADFAVRFARFINERNVMGITAELADAERDVEQNVNPRMVFFDMALRLIVLLIQ